MNINSKYKVNCLFLYYICLWGTGGIAPLIFKSVTKWIFAPRPSYFKEKNSQHPLHRSLY